MHTIGNLTLVTQALNSSVSNSAFADKKQEFVVHAALWINGYFQTVNEWNEHTIEARSKVLFDYALKLWPRPEVAAGVVLVPGEPPATFVCRYHCVPARTA